MPGSSQFRQDLSAAVATRLQAQGHIQDSSQLAALLDDIETIINNDSATVLANVSADLGIFTDPPAGGN